MKRIKIQAITGRKYLFANYIFNDVLIYRIYFKDFQNSTEKNIRKCDKYIKTFHQRVYKYGKHMKRYSTPLAVRIEN